MPFPQFEKLVPADVLTELQTSCTSAAVQLIPADGDTDAPTIELPAENVVLPTPDRAALTLGSLNDCLFKVPDSRRFCGMQVLLRNAKGHVLLTMPMLWFSSAPASAIEECAVFFCKPMTWCLTAEP